MMGIIPFSKGEVQCRKGDFWKTWNKMSGAAVRLGIGSSRRNSDRTREEK
jgi:hypothetical protein